MREAQISCKRSASPVRTNFPQKEWDDGIRSERRDGMQYPLNFAILPADSKRGIKGDSTETSNLHTVVYHGGSDEAQFPPWAMPADQFLILG